MGPRSEERLIRAAEDRDVEVAALAVLGLAKAEAPTAIELLVKSIRDETTPFASRRLRCAALRLGAASVAPLARRVHGDGGQRSAHLLSILRAVPFGQGVPSLLRALDASRGTLLERDLCATLAMGDLEVVHAIRAALEHPGRGLLTAALTYLSAYATVDDIPLLIGLVDRHPPLRGILLILLFSVKLRWLPFVYDSEVSGFWPNFKQSIMPITVPNRPSNGAMPAIVPRVVR